MVSAVLDARVTANEILKLSSETMSNLVCLTVEYRAGKENKSTRLIFVS